MPRHATPRRFRSLILVAVVLVGVAGALSGCQKIKTADDPPIATTADLASADARLSGTGPDDVLVQVAQVGGIAGINQPTTVLYGDGRIVTAGQTNGYRTITVSADDRRVLLASAVAGITGDPLPEKEPYPDMMTSVYSVRTEAEDLKPVTGTHQLAAVLGLIRNRAVNGTPTSAPPLGSPHRTPR